MMLAATITFVDEDLCRGYSGKFGYLRVRGFKRVAIVRIAVQCLNPDYPTTLGSCYYRHLATELVFLVLFPFRDAFHFRRLHAVKLVFVCSLLLIDAEGPFQVLRQLLVQLQAAAGGFALQVADYPAQVSAQPPRLSTRPFQLLRVRVAPLLL